MGKPLSCHTLQVIFSAGPFYNRNQVIKQTTDERPGWFNSRTRVLRLCPREFRYITIPRNTLAIQMPYAFLVNFNLTDQSNLLFHH